MSKPQVPTSNVTTQTAPSKAQSKVKTVSVRLNGENSKYPPQKSQPKLPTLKVKTLSAHLNGQNPKSPLESSKP